MILEDVIQFLRKNPPFEFLDEATLKSIAGSLTMEFYPKNTVILKQGGPPSDSIRIVKKGAVKVMMGSGGAEDAVIDYKGEGDNFGFLSLIGRDRQRTTVIAVDDTICYILKSDKVQKLLDTNMAFAEYFISYLSRYIDRTYQEMRNKSLLTGSTDHLLFTTKAGDISSPAVTVRDDATIQEAAQIMTDQKVSSLVVIDKRNLPAGIITDKDLRGKVVAKGRGITDTVRTIMSISLIRAEANESCFSAILRMIKYNIHHLPVIQDGEIKGVMTNHDLMLLQGSSPLSLVQNVENQRTIEGLIPISGKISSLMGLLLKEGATADNVASIITEINDRLIRKAIDLAEQKFGPPSLPCCWIVFGSGGRREQIFMTDQDNGVAYADTASPDEEDEVKRYFTQVTLFVQDALLKIGFPPCPSGFMASNPAWCRPLSTWKQYFSEWTSSPSPEVLLRQKIFFDLRPIHGKASISDELRESFLQGCKTQDDFLRIMALTALGNQPPIGVLKGFVVEKSGEHKDQFDLKMKGLFPIVDAVRLFALESGVKETSTLGRIAALRARHPIVKEFGQELEYAFEFLFMLMLHQQYDKMKSGKAPDNYLNPNTLSNIEKKTTQETFRLLAKLQDRIRQHYSL